MTQQDIAKFVGTTQPVISRVFRGLPFGKTIAKKIAASLNNGTAWNELFTMSPDEIKKQLKKAMENDN